MTGTQLDDVARSRIIADAIRGIEYQSERESVANQALHARGLPGLRGYERTQLWHGAKAEHFERHASAVEAAYAGQSGPSDTDVDATVKAREALKSIAAELGMDLTATDIGAMTEQIRVEIRKLQEQLTAVTASSRTLPTCGHPARVYAVPVPLNDPIFRGRRPGYGVPIHGLSNFR